LTPPPARTVLGIDPGSHTTGYAFLRGQDSRIEVLEYGAIRCKAQDELSDRLLHIVQELEGRVQLYQPDHLCMESAFFAKNAKSALVLGHVRGAIMVMGRRHGLGFSEISPRSVKQAVTGSGSASKERVALMIAALLRLNTLSGPTDASDALAIAWTKISPSPLAMALPPPKTRPRAHAAPSAPKGSQSHIATALPPGTDIQAFLQAHRRKNKGSVHR
jgi:crossover junction endodeoxyribonuclease RuvC